MTVPSSDVSAPYAATLDAIDGIQPVVWRWHAARRLRDEARGDGLRCPECGSTNVDCTSDRKHHLHECHDCGYRTEAAPVKR